MLTRRCHNCELIKPLTEFGRDRSNNSGRSYQCRNCRREYDAKRRNTPQRRLQQMATSIIHRVNKRPHYQDIECLIGETTGEVYNYLASYFFVDVAVMMAEGKRPSIDRVDPRGNYEHGNLRIIDTRENERRGGITAKMKFGYPINVIWPDGRRELYGSLSEASRELGIGGTTIRRLLDSGRMSKKFGCRIEKVGGS